MAAVAQIVEITAENPLAELSGNCSTEYRFVSADEVAASHGEYQDQAWFRDAVGEIIVHTTGYALVVGGQVAMTIGSDGDGSEDDHGYDAMLGRLKADSPVEA